MATALRKKSQTLNLFSSKDRELLESKHFPDALAYFELGLEGRSLLDIGTGGGVPGLVLGVVDPELVVVLLDSTQKKLDALGDVIEELRLENVETLWGRIEELAHGEWRAGFEVVTARALAPLPVLLEYAAGFLMEEGHLVAWKSGDYSEELRASENAQEALGLKFERAFDYELKGGEKRSLLVFKKTGELGERFPRAVGVPSKRPL